MRPEEINTAPAEPQAAASGRDLWRRSPTFRLLLIGQGISTIGSQVTVIGLPFLLLTGLHPRTFVFGLVAASRYLPFLLLGPIAGMLADRFEPRRLMIIADLGRLLLILCVPVLLHVGRLTPGIVVLIMILVASFRVVFDMALSVYTVRAFNEANLVTVNSATSVSSGLGEIVGPAIAAGILAVASPSGALVFDAVTFAVSLGAVLAMAPAPASAAVVPAADKRATPKRGGRAVLRASRSLRLLLTGAALQNAALMTLQAVAVVHLVTTQKVSDRNAALIIGVFGVGGVAGAALARRIGQALSVTRTVALVPVLTSLGILLIALSLGPDTAIINSAAGYLLVGIGFGAGGIFITRYRQALIPREVFGRVSGIYGAVVMGALPVGSLIGGLVADLASTTVAVVTAGVIAAATLPAFLLATRAARDEGVDAEGFL